MPRRKTHIPLNVLMNNRLVGQLIKASSGMISFSYAPDWLGWQHAMPISLSLPLQEKRYTGVPVSAVFDNLLPDAASIRQRVAEKVGAAGTDSYSLLSSIGRDCVGALQFLPEGEQPDIPQGVDGDKLNEHDIAELLDSLQHTPLGMDDTDDFRLSIAGAQEKTALLLHQGQWLKPHGTTPTTHIFKPPIGPVRFASGTVDLSHSVENEFYCMTLLRLFGLDTANVSIQQFADRKTLVIERFDRHWTDDGRLLRLPQEDFCQAMGIPPTQKYQHEGGPGFVDIMKLLQGSDNYRDDQLAFLKSQLLFWLMGATDGHGKNFSLHLLPGGRYRLTPFYDVLTVQPALQAKQIQHKNFRLAMAVGNNNHYKIQYIRGEHFIENCSAAGLPKKQAQSAIHDIRDQAATAFQNIEQALPSDFPDELHQSIKQGCMRRLRSL